jgi:hypothetical protein
MHRPALMSAIAACLLVAACGGAVATRTALTATPGASGAPGVTGPPAISPLASAVGSFDGTALCAFLQAELPALQKAGSTGGAVSVLAIDYANWIAADASRVLPDAAAMDAATETSCPAIRTDVLKTLGGDSFSVAF